MKRNPMVLGPAIQIASRIGGLLLKTSSADIKILQKAGWKPGAAKGISHGIFAGSAANYLKDDNGIEPDGIPQKPGYGPSANKPNKTRSRSKRYSRSRRCVNNYNRRSNRYSNSRRRV